MIRREASRFLIVGLTTVCIDLCCYSLLAWLGMSVSPAKALGFVIGALFAYFANKQWTFSTKGSWRRFYGFASLYGSTFATNVGLNALVIDLLSPADIAFLTAFLIATGTSATLNFLGMKFLIFQTIPSSKVRSS